MKPALPCMSAITHDAPMRTAASKNCFSDQERRLYSARGMETLYLPGDASLMTRASKESVALYSETKAPTDPATSFDRRMRLLIASGLIAGIIPSSIRHSYAQGTLDIAFFKLDGEKQDA